jgi:DivIVA domain-containing protein
MPWVFALLALVLIVAFALVLAGRLPTVPQPTRVRYTAQLPQRPSAADVDQLRLPVAVRGYRMDDVDAALATLRDRIAELEAQTSVGSAGPSDPPPTGTGIPFAPEPGNG